MDAEAATRDAGWLKTGNLPKVDYESDRARHEFKPHERHTARILSSNGFKVLVRERSNVEGRRTSDCMINGHATDFKSPIGGTKNTIDGLIRQAARQGAAVVIDLSARANGISDADAISSIPHSLKRRGLEHCILIKHDGSVVRLRPEQ